MLEASRGCSFLALLHKFSLPLIVFIYFPSYKPGAGLVVAVVLLGMAFAIWRPAAIGTMQSDNLNSLCHQTEFGQRRKKLT